MSVNRWGDIFNARDPDNLGADGSPMTFVQSGHLDVPGWEARYIGKGIWDLIPQASSYYKMEMTAAAVTLDCRIPIGHRLVRFEWKHTSALYADSVDATAAILSRIDYVMPLGAAVILWRLYYEAASTSSSTVVPFGEGYEYLAATYRLSFNTTNTDLIFPRLWIQEIKP